jgi:hypothetical protein
MVEQLYQETLCHVQEQVVAVVEQLPLEQQLQLLVVELVEQEHQIILQMIVRLTLVVVAVVVVEDQVIMGQLVEQEELVVVDKVVVHLKIQLQARLIQEVVSTLPSPAGGCKVAKFTVSGTLTVS